MFLLIRFVYGPGESEVKIKYICFCLTCIRMPIVVEFAPKLVRRTHLETKNICQTSSAKEQR